MPWCRDAENTHMPTNIDDIIENIFWLYADAIASMFQSFRGKYAKHYHFHFHFHFDTTFFDYFSHFSLRFIIDVPTFRCMSWCWCAVPLSFHWVVVLSLIHFADAAIDELSDYRRHCRRRHYADIISWLMHYVIFIFMADVPICTDDGNNIFLRHFDVGWFLSHFHYDEAFIDDWHWEFHYEISLSLIDWRADCIIGRAYSRENTSSLQKHYADAFDYRGGGFDDLFLRGWGFLMVVRFSPNILRWHHFRQRWENILRAAFSRIFRFSSIRTLIIFAEDYFSIWCFRRLFRWVSSITWDDASRRWSQTFRWPTHSRLRRRPRVITEHFEIRRWRHERLFLRCLIDFIAVYDAFHVDIDLRIISIRDDISFAFDIDITQTLRWHYFLSLHTPWYADDVVRATNIIIVIFFHIISTYVAENIDKTWHFEITITRNISSLMLDGKHDEHLSRANIDGRCTKWYISFFLIFCGSHETFHLRCNIDFVNMVVTFSSFDRKPTLITITIKDITMRNAEMSLHDVNITMNTKCFFWFFISPWQGEVDVEMIIDAAADITCRWNIFITLRWWNICDDFFFHFESHFQNITFDDIFEMRVFDYFRADVKILFFTFSMK